MDEQANWNPGLVRLVRRTKISGIVRMAGLPDRILRLDCEKCRYIEEGLFTYANDSTYYGRQQWSKFTDLASRHNPDSHQDVEPRSKFSHEGNGAPNGTFAGTLTKAPDWKETQDDMIRAMHKIMEQNTCPVEKYAWYLEYTDAGLPHIHFIYKTVTGGRIHQKVFKRYWKQWDEKSRLGKGHRGGYHAFVKSEVAYKEYIGKDGGIHQDRWTGSDEISPAGI